MTDTKILHDCVTLVRNVLHIPDDVPASVCSENGPSEENRTISDTEKNHVRILSRFPLAWRSGYKFF